MPSQDRAPVALALGGLFSLAAAMGIGRFVYTPILPFMADGLNLPAEDAGLIASANFLGYLAGALAGTSKSLPGRPRVWFLGGLLVSALTSAAMALTVSLWAFLFIRFVSGVASAFVLVFSTTLILDRLNVAGRGGLSALYFAGVGCGIAFSALLVAGLDQMAADWRQLWLASGGATLVFLLIAAGLVPDEPPAAKAPADGSTRLPADASYINASLLRLILAYGLFGFGYVITATFVSTIARSTPELQSTEQLVWLAVGLCAAPSIYVWNRIALRTGARRAFALACMLEATGVALTVAGTGPALFLLGAALLGATFMGITALGLMETRRQASAGGLAAIRQMLAVLTASFGLGQVLGPWFAGRLYEMTGSFQLPSLAAAAALVIAAALVGRQG
ncbi:YbfB/YjiJ family MFS transporter [Roseibium salinum]|uniref:YbfB/YjiJ family MFS transporter n=1 Tax=Roseibium salinum TaxID=1604349 RepID=A0ABT3QZ32_9HYPH|nr:YbfB/YjiJ family MFS transporter [Roseibium sp. DSM 29163]MCX2722214.1 YbfB/YjiJ family MFS transporter [Roseibium sp. DSM 29163]